MIKYCNPKICIFNKCNIRTKKITCKKHNNFRFDFIPYYLNYDPFIIESNIIKFQYLFRNRKILKKCKIIINNLNILANQIDPVSQEKLFENKYLCVKLDDIYPILKNNKMYIYKLESLLQIIEYDKIEIFSKCEISTDEINNIKFFCELNHINIKKEKLTKKEQLHIKKTEAFQKLDIMGTYFPLGIYNKIPPDDKIKIFNELKLMWNAFCIDNCIDQYNLYNQNINWNFNITSKNIDYILTDQINVLLKDEIDYNIKKMISYIIIGAFAYVNLDIKNIYNDFDFI